MKIHILPVPAYLRPATGFVWPPGNTDYGVEQDFLEWLRAQYETLAIEPGEADWHYLPVFWNRYYLNAGLGTAYTEPSAALADGIAAAIIDPARTFTICEFDPYRLTRNVNLDGVTVFTGNRTGERGIDIPILRNVMYPRGPVKERRWLASFIGHNGTHKMRLDMFRELGYHRDVHCEHGNRGAEVFGRLMRSSYVALAPRGDGAQSFRLYEAMEYGTVPLYLSDIDGRPFRRWLDWDAVSLYRDTTAGLYDYLAAQDKAQLLDMGNAARTMYYDHLQYGRWCPYVLKELEAL